MKTRHRTNWQLMIIGLIFFGLAGCKIEIEHELWLNADDSGKAKVELRVNLPLISETEATTSLNSENVLEALAQKVRNNPGTTLTELKTSSNHTAEDFTYIYTLDFSFANLQSLREVLFISPDKGLSVEKIKKKKQLTIDMRQLAMQDEGQSAEYLTMMDIALILKLHLPQKPKVISKEPSPTLKDKSVSWEFMLNDDYLADAEKLLKVQY